jgi:CBS domain-containing protein
LIEAARLLHAGADLVVACDSEGTFAGVITKTDIVGRISQGHRSDCVTLASLMVSQDVVLCRPSDNLAGILSVMKNRGFKNVPVIDAVNRPIGVLNSSDALQFLLDQVENEDASLRDYVMGVGYR